MTPPSDTVLLFGRFHPLLVHLPIGLLVLLAFLELLARWPRFNKANASAGSILALAVPASIVTAVCGWLLSRGGGYENSLLQWHKWTGIAVATMCAGIGLVYWLDLKKLYRWGLVATFAALVGASLGKLTSPVAVQTRGGEILNVYFRPQSGACRDVYLEGDARVVYQGELWVEELK